MKKLMIVAAAVAVAGIVEAVPTAPSNGLYYDATFTLKTTVGKDSKQTQTYNLGKSVADVFWYEDNSLTNYIDASDMSNIKLLDKTNFTFKVIKKQPIPVPTKAGLENYDLYTNLVALANSGVYGVKSAGVWCYTFKGTDPVCYRVAGTIKVSGIFWDDDCLTTLVGGAPSTLTTSFVDAFGAYTLIDANGKIKSNKVELYADDVATVVNSLQKYSKKNGWEPVDVLDSNKGDRTINVLSVAGHGTYGYVYDDTNDKVDWPGVTAVSGSAVGTADLPECVSCCAPNTPTSPFDCCGYTSTETAVFGTFTIKYNNSLTKSDLY